MVARLVAIGRVKRARAAEGDRQVVGSASEAAARGPEIVIDSESVSSVVALTLAAPLIVSLRKSRL
jgi:hypothetical protein